MALSTRQSQAIMNGASRVDVAKSNITSKQAGVSASSQSVINNLMANKPITPTAPSAPQSPRVAQAPQAPQAPAFDSAAYMQQANDMVNSIYEKQKQAQLAQLYASRDKAVGQINQQKAEVTPQYAAKKNETDVVNNQNVQRLRELMGANGLNASGENVTATVGLQNARQSALNGLNLQEQQTNNDFNRQISDLNNPANEQALVASIEAQKSQALYDAFNKASDRGYQSSQDTFNNNLNLANLTGTYNGQNTMTNTQMLAQLTGKYNGQNTYQAQQDAIQNAMNQAQLTGTYNGKSTYQAQQDAINNAINQASVTGKYNGQDTLAAQQLALQKAQFKSDTDWRKYAYTHMSKSEQSSLDWAKKQYGEDAAWRLYETQYNGNITLSNNQAQIDALKNSNFSTTLGGSGTKEFQSNMSQAVKMGVNKDWVPLLTEIVSRESSFNPNAKNPKSTAYGYGQFLQSTRATYEKKTGLNYDNPVHQLVMMAQYIKDRYGTPEKALAFWQKNHWY